MKKKIARKKERVDEEWKAVGPPLRRLAEGHDSPKGAPYIVLMFMTAKEKAPYKCIKAIIGDIRLHNDPLHTTRGLIWRFGYRRYMLAAYNVE